MNNNVYGCTALGVFELTKLLRWDPLEKKFTFPCKDSLYYKKVVEKTEDILTKLRYILETLLIV